MREREICIIFVCYLKFVIPVDIFVKQVDVISFIDYKLVVHCRNFIISVHRSEKHKWNNIKIFHNHSLAVRAAMCVMNKK